MAKDMGYHKSAKRAAAAAVAGRSGTAGVREGRTRMKRLAEVEDLNTLKRSFAIYYRDLPRLIGLASQRADMVAMMSPKNQERQRNRENALAELRRCMEATVERMLELGHTPSANAMIEKWGLVEDPPQELKERVASMMAPASPPASQGATQP